ncbi:HIRAN domain-containing protein [Aquisphaera insulae]|uniref:HIRAN domain-containing protein n=1 Tax=Aquisphaera insulae TaxID=2712864 RepID=UPI0013E9B7F3|nr:HIRAN domain-containing protein [Aquisphaera insulae]
MKFSIGAWFSCRFRFHFTMDWPWTSWRGTSLEPRSDYELARFHIAGFQYHDGPEILEDLMTGLVLTLVREPKNPHDRRAVALRWGGYHLGYVPRDRNPTIARLLDQGAPLEGRIIELNPDGDNEPWKAVRVSVFLIGGHAAMYGKAEVFLPEL